ncbi:MAG TPA: acyl-CoA dehydrogenase family protein [Acidimicrobiales bacterium]|nr:acyl-CoA dehydrogenase family protein [Acidimicrobiales bacterium]
MDFGLSDEQRELVASCARLLAKQSPPERVRAAEPGGLDEALWRALHEVGIVTMAVGEAHGGWGAGLLDAALVAEEVGRTLAAAPVIEAQVAARLLAGVGSPAAADVLAEVLEHGRLVTIAARPARAGVATLVPAGAVCDACVVLDGGRLVLESVAGRSRRPVANLAGAPLADLELTSSVELAAGAAAEELFEGAVDEWLVLTAAALVGMGAAAHEMICGYARERRAFGAPIGSFQGVSHPLADDAANLDGAQLLVRKAAWTLDRRGPRGRELAAMAFAFSSRAVAAATYDAVHFHGGYGFMLEHDAQLFYRRARGWARVWGDAEAADRRAAQARYGAPGGGR